MATPSTNAPTPATNGTNDTATATISTTVTSTTCTSNTTATPTTNNNAKPDVKKSSQFTKTVSMAEAVRDLVSDVNNTTRKSEITRILKAVKINPIQILMLPIPFDDTNIKKQYRRLSLLVHPDRCSNELKENAQKAFTILNNAKKDLENDLFKTKLKHQINEARRAIIEYKMTQKAQKYIFNASTGPPDAKKQKITKNSDVSNSKAPILNGNPDGDDGEIIVTQEELKEKLGSIIVDDAWNKHCEDKASQKIEQQTLVKREELKAKIAAKKQYQREWEDGRNNRVSSWRDFQNGKKKKKKKKKKNKKKN